MVFPGDCQQTRLCRSLLFARRHESLHRQLVGARAAFEESLSLNLDLRSAPRRLTASAQLRAGKGRLAEALEKFDRARAENSALASAQQNRAQALAELNQI